MNDQNADRPNYPGAVIRFTGQDAFAIIAMVRRALRDAGAPADEIKRFQDEAMSGDYDHLLKTTMRWVTVTS